MFVKQSTIQNFVIGLVLLILALVGVAVYSTSKSNSGAVANAVTQQGDTQIIAVTAKGGYSPRVIQAKAGEKTILKMITKNTFDCSSSLVIPKLGVQKYLPANGETEIAIPAQTAGTVIDASCSMGMYSFKINFV